MYVVFQVSNYESGSSIEMGDVPNSDSHFGLDDILIDVPTMEESSTSDFHGHEFSRHRFEQQVSRLYLCCYSSFYNRVVPDLI